MPARPRGRSLADFEPLLHAEQNLLESCRRGDECFISGHRPGVNRKTAANTVRAGFLRFLILGGDDENPVHERGVLLQGAWIDGVLDLAGVTSTSGVLLVRCWFNQTPILMDAHINGSLILTGSRTPGLLADRLTCDASLFCDKAFLSDNEIRLPGAKIGGVFVCSGAMFNGPKKVGETTGNSLFADEINVKGSVYLDLGFTANGEARLLSAAIGGSFECKAATFNGPGKALSADRIVVKGNVFLSDKFTANGEVRLAGSTIDGLLSCEGAAFRGGAEYNFDAQGMSVAGGFFFRGLQAPAGPVCLAQARVHVLADDEAAWSENLDLEGFTYERIGGSSPMNSKMRLEWLDKQRPEWSGKNGMPDQFRPQPWSQLRTALREAGHPEDARKVGIAFQERRRRCGQIVGTAKFLHWLYGFYMGYGYRPYRLPFLFFYIWFCCGLIYDCAAYRCVFVPTSAEVYPNPRLISYSGSCWVFNPPFGGNYPAFHPFAYSLNVLLPVLDLGQQAAWEPSERPFSPVWWKNLTQMFTDLGGLVQLVIWTEAVLGWGAGLVLVGFFSSITEKDDI